MVNPQEVQEIDNTVMIFFLFSKHIFFLKSIKRWYESFRFCDD